MSWDDIMDVDGEKMTRRELIDRLTADLLDENGKLRNPLFEDEDENTQR